MRAPHAALVGSAVAALALLSACTPGEPDSDSSGGAATLSSSERDDLRDAWLADIAQSRGVEVPDVDLVRYVTSDEWAEAMVTCLNDAGYPGVHLEDGGVASGPITADQSDAYGLANVVCAAQYSIDPTFLAPLNAAQLAVLYEFYVDDLVPCLESEGYEIGTPPSRSTWLETATTSDTYWTPYDDVPYAGQSRWEQINEACPQAPDTATLYGE